MSNVSLPIGWPPATSSYLPAPQSDHLGVCVAGTDRLAGRWIVTRSPRAADVAKAVDVATMESRTLAPTVASARRRRIPGRLSQLGGRLVMVVMESSEGIRRAQSPRSEMLRQLAKSLS